MSSSLGLSGLASGFDWKSFVDQMISVESAPITRMTLEQTQNTAKVAKLELLGAKISSLQTAAQQLGGAGVFNSRKVASTTSGSTWAVTADAGAPVGSYKLSVSQLASTARIDGGAGISSPLSATSDVSGLTIANLPTAAAVTAGSFTVNGQKVAVALTDSLQDVFDAISTATGGEVTASYDSATDKVTLSGSSTVMLGAANDTSNFLSVMRLGNNGTASVTSASGLGAAALYGPLASARLNTAITAVDGTGAGSFTINGETIDYNVNTDSLSDIIARINASTAGVTASYDGTQDRLVLTNKVTGDLGIAVSEASGGLLDALGLTGAATFNRGTNALFTINGGATLSSTSNTLDSTAHGITGLHVTVDEETAQTISVSSDTDSMNSLINGFISSYNDLQDYIEEQTKITTGTDGKVTTAALTDNREVQSWARSLRQIAFNAVSGLSGSISRLEQLGIDFTSGTNKLEVKDSTKLTEALRDHPDDVTQFFQTNSTGLVDQLDTFITNISSLNSDQQERLNNANTDLDNQIANFQRYLDQQRAKMEDAFIRMEDAQSKISSQLTTLTNAFLSSSSSSSSSK